MNRSPLRHVLQRRSSPRRSRRVISAAIGLLTAITTSAVAQEPSSPAEVRTLAPYQVVHRQIEAGLTQVYELTLDQHQFARITVEQHGIDLKLTANGPQSFSIKTDSPNGFNGAETVSLLAAVTGTYRLEVALPDPYPPADYILRVDGPRAATAADEINVSAERAFAEAQELKRIPSTLTLTQAIEKYQEALRLWRETGDLRQQGYSLTNLGRTQLGLHQLAPALQSLKQAETILSQAGDVSGQAFALNEAGAAQRDFGVLQEAVGLNESALKLRINLGDHYGEAQSYNNLGLTYSYMGYQPRALDYYEKALTIWREHHVRHHEMRTLINVAKAQVEMGESEAARVLYQNVLDYCNAELSKENSPLARNARELKPFALNGLGLVYDTQADTDSALANYEEALVLFRQDKKVAEADVLDNLGMTYAFLGDADQAIDNFQQALALRESNGQPRPLGITRSNLGYAYALLKKYEPAREQLKLALQLNAETHDRRFEAYTLVRLGMTEFASQQSAKALEYYERALAIQQEPDFEDRRGQAITLDKIGEALALSGQESEAIQKYESAIERWKTVGDGQGQALSLFGIARIERDRLNLANARDRAEEAIKIVEQLRNRVTGRQLQMTYFAGKQDLYALAIDVRMRLYDAKGSQTDLEAALAFSEKARARNLLDLLSEARVDLHKGMSPQIAERIWRLDREISELTQSLVRFRGIDAKRDVADVQREVNARINESERLLAPFKRRSVRAAQAQPLAPKEIQQLLDDDMLLLQYSLDEKRSHLWAVTRTNIDHYYLAGRSEIEDTANQLRQALKDNEPPRNGESDEEVVKRRQSATARYNLSARELSRLILAKVAPKLGNKRLVIVADGRLHYIPFEALPLPETAVPAQYASSTTHRPLLLLTNEIVYELSASALATLRRTSRRVASNRVAVLADPVFNNDDRNGTRGKTGVKSGHLAKARLSRSLRDIGDIGNGDYRLPRLEYSLAEANAIAAVAPRGSLKAVGFKANRTLATSPLLKQFGFLHFATHGVLNDKNPELSGIILSMVNEHGDPEDGYLTLRDIYNLDLPAHLVVVSACETGIGRSVRGEGLIGLTRGFMNAGAQSVVVSLWRVDDEATAELMKRFYTHIYGKPEMTLGAALRQSKLEMNDRYPPYQWAGFVLQGDWK